MSQEKNSEGRGDAASESGPRSTLQSSEDGRISASIAIAPPRNGYNALWEWFSLSYASWLTMPRVLMHAMPDEWQAKMAELLHEYDDTFNTDDLPNSIVQARRNGKLTRWPEWLLRYRHPDEYEIAQRRATDRSGNPATKEQIVTESGTVGSATDAPKNT